MIDDRCHTPGCGQRGGFGLTSPAPVQGRWCAAHRPKAWFDLDVPQRPSTPAPDVAAPAPSSDDLDMFG